MTEEQQEERRVVVVSWLPTDEEDEALRNAAAGAELVTPTSEQLTWSRFACHPDALEEMLSEADALIGWATPTRRAITNARRLRFIAWLHAGCDSLDLALLDERNVEVANVRGANGVAVAEQAMALLLGLAKRVRQNDAAARDVRWQGWWEPETVSTELAGKSVCIFGYGNIGQPLARMCASFNLRVTVVRKSRPSHAEERTGAGDAVIVDESGAREAITQADFVVLAMPLTSETRHYFDAERFSWLKPGAFLINVARGHLVDERAAYEALTSGKLAGFASDVWWEYGDAMPPSQHFGMPSRLGVQRLPNVLASADSAANTFEVKRRMIDLGLESLAAFLRNEPIPRLIDLKVGY